MSSSSDLIASLALLVAGATAFFAWQQTNATEEQAVIAKQSYDASVEQLALARAAQQTAADQLELQRRALAAERRNSLVLGEDADRNLGSDLSNGQNVSFSLFNGSKDGVIYRVEIKSEGVGVFWGGATVPNKMYYHLPFDKREQYVPSLGTYERTFSVWVGRPAAPKAKISIYVNEQLSAEYNYWLDPKVQKYVYQKSPQY